MRSPVSPNAAARSSQSASREASTLLACSWSEAKSYYYAMDRPNLTDQFYCHFDGRLATFAKGSWNLESWRPDVSYAATLAAGCNP